MSRKVVAPQRRKQIIDALYELLTEKDHRDVTIKDIAKRANLHYGVIHYYFKSKDEIISAMAASIGARYEDRWSKRAKEIDRCDSATEKLRATVRILVDLTVYDNRFSRVFYNLLQMSYERRSIRVALRNLFQEYRSFVMQPVVQKGIENGEFRRCDMNEVSAIMVALVEGMSVEVQIQPSLLKRAEASRMIADVMISYLHRK